MQRESKCSRLTAVAVKCLCALGQAQQAHQEAPQCKPPEGRAFALENQEGLQGPLDRTS